MESRLIRPQREMPVDSVVTKIRFTPHKPLCERRLAEIANLPERFVPINCLGLVRPEGFPLFQGTTTELDRSGGRTHLGGLGEIGVQELQEFRS